MKTIPYLIALGIASLLVQACDKAEPHDETAQIEQPTAQLPCNEALPLGPPPKPWTDWSSWTNGLDSWADPATYSLVNKTSVPIRIAYGPYDGSCLPPKLPTDTYIAPGDSISTHLKWGNFGGHGLVLFFADQIFPSNHLMVIFNEERFVKHANPEDWCWKPSSEEDRDRNLFCGWDYAPTHERHEPPYGYFASYTFTEADRQRAQPLPRGP